MKAKTHQTHRHSGLCLIPVQVQCSISEFLPGCGTFIFHLLLVLAIVILALEFRTWPCSKLYFCSTLCDGQLHTLRQTESQPHGLDSFTYCLVIGLGWGVIRLYMAPIFSAQPQYLVSYLKHGPTFQGQVHLTPTSLDLGIGHCRRLACFLG